MQVRTDTVGSLDGAPACDSLDPLRSIGRRHASVCEAPQEIDERTGGGRRSSSQTSCSASSLKSPRCAPERLAQRALKSRVARGSLLEGCRPPGARRGVAGGRFDFDAARHERGSVIVLAPPLLAKDAADPRGRRGAEGPDDLRTGL